MQLAKPDPIRLFALAPMTLAQLAKPDPMTLAGGYLVLCLATMLPIEGQTQTPQREADKAEAIKRIMAKREFEMRPVVSKQNKAFCEGFLEDFRLQKNVEFIEPDTKSDSYDDPVWQPFRSRCTNLASELFDSYQCEPKIAESIEKMPKEQRDSHYRSECRHYRGTANFKHYFVDINNNPKDGKEHVFYYERAQGPLNRPDAKLNFANGGYWVIDLDRCELEGGSPTNDPFSYFYNRRLDNYNGIIRYKGKHYIFNLSDLDGSDRNPDNPNYRLRLDSYGTYSRKVEPRLGPVCAFGTILERK